MYALLPYKWIGTGLIVVVLMAVYADDIAHWFGLALSDRHVVHYVPLLALMILGGFFGPVGYWAPWRIAWRLVPGLNGWFFPDLNGVWVGTTESNWPTIAKLLEAAQAHRATTHEELQSLPRQEDAIAIQIKASLFGIKIFAGLYSTNSQSHTVTARPRWDPDSGQLHITYVYNQSVPDPVLTDEESHMGAADVQIDLNDLTRAEGYYWTRRKWRLGINTAGKVGLRRLAERRDGRKTLREYAADEKERTGLL